MLVSSKKWITLSRRIVPETLRLAVRVSRGSIDIIRVNRHRVNVLRGGYAIVASA